ncbi:MAG: hypothetical protein PHN75_14990 [Syntrophales bacterium]|nr:hypothetical protein [Syntrophales bacterium]
MICPKCGAEQGEDKLECMRCGVIFAKLTPEDFGHAPPEVAIKSSDRTPESGWADTIKTYLLGPDQEENPLFWAGRILAYLIILIWGGKFIATPMASDYFAETFLHGVNLAFHEAGHVIFAIFGTFIGVLGGSLGQIVMPLICMGTFLFYRNPFAASVALWWTGENFMDLAPYIGDARALQLPLLGGNIGSDNPDFHDWHHILRDLGWLKYDHTLAAFSNHVGVLLMIVSFAWGGYLLYRQYRSIRLG